MTSADVAMDLYAKGDMSAFHCVYDAVAPRLGCYLRRRVREKRQIEDIVQQTFLEMHRARGTFMAGAPVIPWAFTIASNIAIAFGRRSERARMGQLDEEDSQLILAALGRPWAGDEHLDARETGVRLSAAYAQLTDFQRAAFDLVRVEGLSHAEAAAMLGTTVTAIKLRIHKARLALERAAYNDGAGLPKANESTRERAAALVMEEL